MESHLGTGALLAACLVALGAPAASRARVLTAENRAELANVPPSWKDARICFQEGGGVGGPRVVVGMESTDRARHFVIRSERPKSILPEYLLKQAGDIADDEIRVAASAGVGYTDEYHEVFVMPGGVRMTCEALPEKPST